MELPTKNKVNNNDSNKPLGPIIKEMVLEWCKSSTMHGTPSIIRAESIILRLTWIICFLASSAFCFYLICLTIISYFSNPIKTTVSVIDETPTRFPSVSICNLNPFKIDNPKFFSKITSLVDDLNISITNQPLPLYLSSVDRQIKFFVQNSTTTERQQFGNSWDDMLRFCFFNSKPCFLQSFEWFYDFNMGNCYKFNSNGSLTVGKAGFSTSLQMKLFVGHSSSVYDYLYQKGLRILVHNSSLSTPQVYDFGVNVPPGFNIDIQVSRTNYQRLSAPYSSCIDDLTNKTVYRSSIIDIMFDILNLETYSQEICQNLLFQNILLRNCSCVDPAFPFKPFVDRCIKTSQIVCQDSMFQSFYANPTLYDIETQCPKECNWFKYDIRMSQALFPTEWYWNASRINILRPPNPNNFVHEINNYNDAKENYLSVNVFYSELSYTLIKEEPLWDTFTLFSSIGGNLGLFIGMSFLTFVEILEIIYQLLELYFKHLFQNKKTTSVVRPDSFEKS